MSCSLPNLFCKMLFVRLYPSEVKGNASIVWPTLVSTNSLKYVNFVIGAILVLSIVSKN